MKVFSMTRVIHFMTIALACASTGWAQKNPLIEELNRPKLPPAIEQGRKEFTKKFFGGLEPQVGGRIRREINGSGSLLEVPVFFGGNGGNVEDRLNLDQNQRPEFRLAFEKRTRQRVETTEEAFRQAREMSTVDESSLRLIIAKALKKEMEYEVTFSKVLLELLDPNQLDRICKSAMGVLRPEFARNPLVASHLKLSKEQIAKFDRWRMENNRVVGLEYDFRRPLEKDNGPRLSKPQESEVTKYVNDNMTNLNNYARDADNSLTKEQFQFVTRAEGRIRDDETLEDFFDRQPESEQAKIAAALTHFARILEERRRK